MPSAKNPTSVERRGAAVVREGWTIALIASVHVIPELRFRPEVFLEPENLLVRQHPADLAVRIQEIAEDPRARRAGFDTRRITAFTRALDAERALLDNPPHAKPVPQVVLIRVHLVGGNDRVAPVEAARVVGARRDAIAAPDAPVVVDD